MDMTGMLHACAGAEEALRRRWRVALILLLISRLAVHLIIRSHCHGLTFLVSPMEFLRTHYALAWSRAPAVAPDHFTGWLPLQFYAEGLCLRFWPDLLAVPFWFNTALSLAALSLLFFLTRELFDSPLAGLAAAFCAAADPYSIAFGIGGTADPLMHIFLLGALYFWARHERGGASPPLWLAAAFLALGNMTRYEVWLASAAFTLRLVLRRGRKAWGPLALVWAFPVFWLYVNFHSSGDAMGLMNDLSASAYGFRPSMQEFIAELGTHVGSWSVLLCLWGAMTIRRLEHPWYWTALGFIVIPLFIVSCRLPLYYDDHLWTVSLLLYPPSVRGLSLLLRGLGRGQRALAACLLAVCFAVVKGCSLADYLQERTGSQRYGLALAQLQAQQWRREHALGPQDAVLVELPRRRWAALFCYELWRQADPGALFDRDYMRLEEANNPSALDRPAQQTGFWLATRNVRLVLASSHAEVLRALGFRELASISPLTFWCRDGDPLLGQTKS